MFTGLQGVELGGQVIKRIIVDLATDFPRMNQFASLSPVPGFRDWLLDEISNFVRLRGQLFVSFFTSRVEHSITSSRMHSAKNSGWAIPIFLSPLFRIPPIPPFSLLSLRIRPTKSTKSSK